jgi:hypothetical protein
VDACPEVVSATVAVIVAGWPLTSDVGLTVNVVAVVSPGFVPVPLAETCCVLPDTLSVLLVTVMPALMLPVDCGVKYVDTSQIVPCRSDVDEVHGLLSLEFMAKSAVYAGFVEKISG